MSTVHQVAQVGFGHGTNELYDRARPSYPSPVLAHIKAAAAAKSTGLNVVELGSGTGIFTRALLAHPDWASSVDELRAFEPSAGMRQVFTDTVKDSRALTAEGNFQSIPVDDAWADIIVIAQAFHWCADYDAASKEFGRVLKPDGAAVFVWNLEDRDAAGWVAGLRDAIEAHEAGTPQFRHEYWRATFDTPSYQTFFKAPEEKKFPHAVPATKQLAIERAESKSYITTLPEDVKKRVLQTVGEIVDKGEGRVWIDQEKGVFEYPYQTLVVIAHKK